MGTADFAAFKEETYETNEEIRADRMALHTANGRDDRRARHNHDRFVDLSEWECRQEIALPGYNCMNRLKTIQPDAVNII
jgi:hypothetical protein